MRGRPDVHARRGADQRPAAAAVAPDDVVVVVAGRQQPVVVLLVLLLLFRVVVVVDPLVALQLRVLTLGHRVDDGDGLAVVVDGGRGHRDRVVVVVGGDLRDVVVVLLLLLCEGRFVAARVRRRRRPAASAFWGTATRRRSSFGGSVGVFELPLHTCDARPLDGRYIFGDLFGARGTSAAAAAADDDDDEAPDATSDVDSNATEVARSGPRAMDTWRASGLPPLNHHR